MAGTYVQDSLRPKLLDAATVTASANGSSVDLGGPPFDVRVEAVVADVVTGTTPTLDLEVQSSDSSTFASGVVSHGRFKQLTATDASSAVVHYLQARVYHRYMRVVKTIGGTSTPTFTAVTVTVRPREFHRLESTDTA